MSPVGLAGPLAAALERYSGRRVLLTGHTGFKGGWLALWLAELGAEVTGLAMAPATEPSLFEAAGVEAALADHRFGDLRDPATAAAAVAAARPEIVFHLAAQPLVKEGYRDPAGTFATNVLGTAHLLDALRHAADPPAAVVVVTSDKCYENREWVHGYREDDRLGGHDPYSASKACAELVASAYRRSYFSAPGSAGRPLLATARAGNVIGGGDWSPDRLVPDCIRALATGEEIEIRQPDAVRPWQHVLEPLSGYLLLGARLLADADADEGGSDLTESWNFGPALLSDGAGAPTVGHLVERVVELWGEGSWRHRPPEDSGQHEATLLTLAIDKAIHRLGWAPRWGFEETLERTVGWYRGFYREGAGAGELCRRQIAEYVATG